MIGTQFGSQVGVSSVRDEVDREAVEVVGGGGVAFVAADVLAVGSGPE